MKHIVRGFSVVVLLVCTFTVTSMGAQKIRPSCKRQLIPTTMVDLRELYNKSVSPSLTPEQRTMAASLYRQKLKAAEAVYSTTMEKLHEWVIGESGKITQSANDSSHTVAPVNRTIPRIIFHPQLKHILHGHANSITSANFSLDGNEILTTAIDKTVHIWDSRTGDLIDTKKKHNKWQINDVVSDDGNFIIDTSNIFTKIIDAHTKEQIDVLIHNSMVLAAVASPKGKLFATASEDCTAQIWDLQTLKELKTLTGHKGAVTDVAFSPDGTKIVTTSTDETARIWELYITEDKLLGDADTTEDAP